MPKSAADHQSAKFVKLLLIGESGSGKTGALLSLVKAGYKLRIIDLDNGLDFLMRQIRKQCPQFLENVEFETVRDKFKGGSGGIMPFGIPTAYTEAVTLLSEWKHPDGTKSNPGNWGPDTIMVIDSLTFLGNSAYIWYQALNPDVKDNRQVYFGAQESVESVLDLTSSDDFATNLIVISHINWVERQDGTKKAYPSAIGSALSPTIPTYFNSYACAESMTTASETKRTIRTNSTMFMDLKNAAGLDMLPTLPLESGLDIYFKTLLK